jgi:hypothetical protein
VWVAWVKAYLVSTRFLLPDHVVHLQEYGKRIQGAASFAVDLDLNGVMQCGTRCH